MKAKKEAKGLDFHIYEQKIFFQTEDGLRLCGVLTRPKQPTQKCIILCHGITAHKDKHNVFTDMASMLAAQGYASFRFDFRAHGESEGDSVDLTVKGEEKDFAAAVNLLHKFDFKDFGVIAASFGGGPVSMYCRNNREVLKAIVFWNAAIDYSKIIQLELPFIEKHIMQDAIHKIETQGFIELGRPRFRIGKKLYHEICRIKPWKGLLNLNTPMLFIHGDKDKYVPYSDSVKYSHMFRNAELRTIHGAHHGFVDSKEITDQADQAAINFFLGHL